MMNTINSICPITILLSLPGPVNSTCLFCNDSGMDFAVQSETFIFKIINQKN